MIESSACEAFKISDQYLVWFSWDNFTPPSNSSNSLGTHCLFSSFTLIPFPPPDPPISTHPPLFLVFFLSPVSTPTSHPSANFPNLPRNLFPAWLCSNKMVDCTSMVHRVVSCHWALEENRSHYLKALCISLSLKV